ncbi:MAG: efflux RND transporter permease subunit [Candidatus Saccharibacteria bacterium]|nr:efflux RND transporter permease subunit [Candidatus Saccharibacteria bacterium]
MKWTLMKKQRRNTSANDTKVVKLSLLFFDWFKSTFVIWVCLVVLGVLAYVVFLPREGFPAIQAPYGLATGSYLVQNAEEVDSKITKPASDVLQDVAGVESVRTQADDSFFTIIAQFEEGTSSEAGTKRMREAIETAGFMPEEATVDYTVIAPALYLNKYDMTLSVYSPDNGDVSKLQAASAQASRELTAYDAIETAEIQEQFSTGTNPQTGQEITRQSSFDRIGIAENNELEFYPAFTIGIVGNDNLDVIELSDAVRSAINQIEVGDSSNTYEIAVSGDFAPSITTQIASLESNMVSGLVAIVVISFLLISWRASLITALFMTSVMMTTLLVLWLVGYTLNTISLFALVLALGLFVDDATIVVEAVDAARRKGKDKREVVRQAIKKVAAASIAGTLTTVLVFAPLVFITGILGEFIQILPITIIVALVSSLVLSLTLIPFLSRFVLLRGRRQATGLSPIVRAESFLAAKLAQTPLILNRSRKKGVAIASVFVVLSIFIIAAGGYYGGQLKFNIFPETSDADQLSLSINYNQATSVEESIEVSKRIETTVQQKIGEHVRLASYGAYSQPSQRSATMFIELEPFTQRTTTSQEMIGDLELAFEEFSSAQVQVNQIDAGPPSVEFPFAAQVYAEDKQGSAELARDIAEFLEDRDISRPDGSTARIINTEIAHTDRIVRRDGDRFVRIGAAFDASDTTALVQATQKAVEREFDADKLRSDYGVEPQSLQFDFGQESQNQESFSSLLLIGPLSVLAMFLLLAVQFRSLLQPLLIFMAIPFSLFGVTYGLYATNNPISFFTMIGFFGLLGIAVNNTILLTDYANQERRAGKSLAVAVSEATRQRFRPLVVTSLTTIAALTPLALSDPFWEPLAVTIIFGLISSTFLVIIAFPYYYLIAEYVRQRISRRRVIFWLIGLATVIGIAFLINALVVPLVCIYILVSIALNRFWRMM